MARAGTRFDCPAQEVQPVSVRALWPWVGWHVERLLQVLMQVQLEPYLRLSILAVVEIGQRHFPQVPSRLVATGEKLALAILQVAVFGQDIL